jgi:hypothetical protein
VEAGVGGGMFRRRRIVLGEMEKIMYMKRSWHIEGSAKRVKIRG